MGDAKALFFINYDEPELREREVVRENPVRTDQDIDIAFLSGRNDVGLLCLGTEPRE